MIRGKTGIPAIPRDAGALGAVLEALKQNVEQLTGARGKRIEKLDEKLSRPAEVRLNEAILKINEIIDRLNV